MKKSLFVAMVALAFILTVCIVQMQMTHKKQNDDTATNETISENTSDETQDDNQADTSKVPNAGKDLVLADKIDSRVYHLIFVNGTFTDDCLDHLKYYEAEKEELGIDYIPVFYYLAKEMKLTREDVELYYKRKGYSDIPEYIYEGIFAETLEDAVRILKTEYIFYVDGKLYNVYEVFDMYSEGTLTFDINDPKFDDVWGVIYAHVSSVPAYNYEADFISFVESKGEK